MLYLVTFLEILVEGGAAAATAATMASKSGRGRAEGERRGREEEVSLSLSFSGCGCGSEDKESYHSVGSNGSIWESIEAKAQTEKKSERAHRG